MARGNTQVQAAPLGSAFGLPGVTQPFEQFDAINGFLTAAALAQVTPWNPPATLQKTDIIRWWEMEVVVNWTTTVTLATLSPMAPYNFLQGEKLKMQGQYSPLEVESGMDGSFFQAYRPMRGPGQQNSQTVLETSPAAWGSNAATAQANQNTTGITTNPANGTTWQWTQEIPGGLFIEQYWDIARDGSILAPPRAAWVSPQYMSNGDRTIVPAFNIAAINAANSDVGPLVGSTAGAANVTTNLRRVGYYGTVNPASMPPVFAWQYRRTSKRFPIGAVTKVDIPITEFGQLLSVFVRIFDPTAGTFYNIANYSKAQLIYGSGLARFDDDVLAMQDRFMNQHGFLPPLGHLAWDLLANTSGSPLSNDMRVLNTLTNANTKLHLEMSPAPNSTAYAVIGTELLVPVEIQ
jgi:hypothetical protein